MSIRSDALPARYLNAYSSARSTKPPIFSPSQIGICRAISGETLMGWSAESKSRMRPCAWSIRLTKMRCGMPSSSSARRAGAARGARDGIGVDDDDGDVGDRQSLRAVGREADRSRDVEDGELVAEIAEIVEVEFGRSAALAGFGARIADAGAVGRRSEAVGGAGCEQHRFGKAGLSRAGGSHQRDYSSAFCRFSSHATLPSCRDGLRESLRGGARAPIWKPPPSACFRRFARGERLAVSRCWAVEDLEGPGVLLVAGAAGLSLMKCEDLRIRRSND